LPVSTELNICEGRLLEIGNWDGTGYPCLIENACTFGNNPPKVWIYDFDLWNFRHDLDNKNLKNKSANRITKKFVNMHAWHAYRRFGNDFERIIKTGDGMLSRQIYGIG